MNGLLKASIPENVIIPPGKLLLAFSGGSDSLFLMAVLSVLAPERTEAVYVDHSLRSREELEREIELNRKNAASLGIPLRVVHIPEGFIKSQAKNQGIESAARSERYRILSEIAESEGFDYILTAHHREDQVETVLMRILSSAPFCSYRGILQNDGIIFRPILSVSKKEILSFLLSSGLEWAEDSTNSDTSYLRNHIRHRVLPFISEEARCLISSIAGNVAEFRKRIPNIPYTGNFFLSVERKAFLEAFPFQRDELVYSIFKYSGCNDRVSRKIVADIFSKAQEGKGQMLFSGMSLYFSRDNLRFYPLLDDFAVEYSRKDIKIGRILLKHIVPDPLTICIDEKRLCFPVVLRTAREGDRIELREGERRISDLEKNMRIPYSIVLEDRNGIAVYFARFAGGRDRLAKRFLTPEKGNTALAIEIE